MTDRSALMSTRSDQTGLTLSLHVSRFDASVADVLKAEMKSASMGDGGPVTVDLGSVDFIDSSGLGALVALRKSLTEDRPVVLRNLRPFVRRVLGLTRLDRVFAVAA